MARARMAAWLLLGVGLFSSACNNLTGVGDLRIGGEGEGAGDPGTTGSATGAGGATTATTASTAATTATATTSATTTTTTSSTTGGGVTCMWPTGPGGAVVGATVSQNLAWQGYPEGTTQLGVISIEDYFDCDGSKGENALLVLQSATWCAACQDEASGIPAQVASWAGKGIRVLTLMIENATGNAATPQTALSWKNAFSLDDVAVAADPNFSFAPPGGSVGLPLSLLVDPRTMKIVHVEEGYSGDYSAVEQLAAKNAQ